MLVEKKMLSAADLESQVALELPDREMLLITVVITNLLNNNVVRIPIDVDVSNVDIAAQICANVVATGRFLCTVEQ
jgi:hypothetical protein